MVFFRLEPNLPDAGRARIEFHLQQLADCIGFDRFRLPVLRQVNLQGMAETRQGPQRIIDAVGEHLSHDTSGIAHEFVPQPIQKRGGG